MVTEANILLFLMVSLIFFGSGALGSLLLGSSDRGAMANLWAHGLAALGSLAMMLAGVLSVLGGQTLTLATTLSLPLFSVTDPFRLDPLASILLAVIGLVGLAASLYGIGYQRHALGHYKLNWFGVAYNVFLASLAFVVTANHALVFMVAWELMTLSSYFLVVFEHREASTVKAGLLYFLMTQLGSAFLLLLFFGLATTLGSLSFDAYRASAGNLPVLTQNLLITCALIGFGTKAGIIPLHIWLPEAHPAAPSHVSALMSGVMIKTAIVLLVRVFFEFFPAAGLTWGLVILGLGIVSSVLGVLYALAEHDLKRLLAFHSVENIGIILLGLGASIIFGALGNPALAVIALAAALFHTINHATFKSLLFLGAGSVIVQTGTRNIEHFGGLLRRMPLTGFWFLVGAAAISALPPLNGFASEWLTFQSLFAGLDLTNRVAQGSFLLAIAALALTGGLAAACFVKAFGATFLARPRSDESAQAHESDWTMTLPMALLGLACVGLGLGAGPVTAIISRVSEGLVAGVPLAATQGIMPSAPLASTGALLVLVLLLVGALVAWLTRGQRTIIGPTWDCGVPLTERGEITATSFSRSLGLIFRGVLRPTKQTAREYVDATTRYFTKSQSVTLETPNLYLEHVYRPLYQRILQLTSWIKTIQSGNINGYLLYGFITLIALLVWATHI